MVIRKIHLHLHQLAEMVPTLIVMLASCLSAQHLLLMAVPPAQNHHILLLLPQHQHQMEAARPESPPKIQPVLHLRRTAMMR